MDLSLIPYVEYVALENFVGPAAVRRGLDYADNGHVRNIKWDEGELHLQGRVSGSRGEVYTTSAFFEDEPKGAVII
ncbi:hypothetical protein AOC05_12235 [Arthrobacter alpinus]|uniref:Uncharacterized protein n=1 Tax=Arthrobacter alpinus TaxID=656366 RepID=A0A0M3UGD2_9MICC|nr:hypothetical protein [Arthrobacter alpinus]ALE92885.1 hypothetical protein AOC05_12235 [Arthrobacter alpinus]